MRKFSHTIELPISKSGVWKELTDINKYPEYLKFVKKVKVLRPLGKEGVWQDLHTVLFIPLLTKHFVIEFEPEKKIVYMLKLPFLGKVIEEIEVVGINKGTKATFTIEIYIPNKFFDSTLGNLLEKRLRILVDDLVVKIQNQKSKPF